MASGDPTSPPSCPGLDVQQLNLPLLRVLLRFPVLGSPLFLEEEERLVQALLPTLRELIGRRPWLSRRYDPDGLATGTCFDLMLSWRAGVPLWFSRAYLWNRIRQHLEKDGAMRGGALDLEAVAGNKSEDAGLAEEIDKALATAAAFRAGLGPADQELLDAWIRHAGHLGWQIAHARRTGRSPAWVSNHLNRLRQQLRKRHHITDPDDFIDAVQFYAPGDNAELPEADAVEEAAPAENPEARPPRVDLAEAFQGDAALLDLMRAYGDQAGLTEQQVLRVLGGEPARLEALLTRGVERYLHWAREVGRPRQTAWKFYRRLASGRVNVEAALARADDGTADARRLVELARPGNKAGTQPSSAISFEDLPARLGLGRRQVDEVLLRLRSAVHGRGPHPLSGS